MEEKTIPYIAHEAEASRLERSIRRLWILAMLIFAVLVLTNVAWVYESLLK